MYSQSSLKTKLRNLKQNRLNKLLDKDSYNDRGLEQLKKAIEQGNEALLDLQYEYEMLAEKKRNLLREIDELEDKKERYENKMEAAENLYGRYLEAIKEGKENEA